MKEHTCYLWVVAVVAGLLTVTACQTTNQPGSNSLASMQIASASAEQIFPVVVSVFVNAGFNLTQTLPSSRVFERPGGRADAERYGDWGGSGVMMRATVSAQKWGNSWLVECNVVAVRDYEDPAFEDTNPVRGAEYRKEYQSMLDRVLRQLQGR